MTRLRALITLSLFVAGPLAGAATGCKESKQPAAGPGGPADSAEQVMYGVRTFLTTKGVQRGELTADTAYIYNDQTRFDFRNAKVNFNTETGAPNGTMRADRALYDIRTQILQGFGNVVITTTDGRRLSSPQLKFNQYANEVSSDTSFELITADKTQRGVGFTADPKLTHWTCKKQCGGSGLVPIPAK
jgi:LPS export ABC transporter protein LptC